MVVGFLKKFLKTTDIDCPIERVTSQASFIQFISPHLPDAGQEQRDQAQGEQNLPGEGQYLV